MGLISMNMEEKIFQIPIEDIIPNRFQPRLTFEDSALQELAESIKQHGIIQPLVLRKLGDKFEIIAGERRYKASQIAGLTVVPAVISDIDDDKSAEVALVENIQRKNLTSIEEARSYKNLLDRGYLTQEQLANKMGISQSTIANKLRLLNLDETVQDALLNEKISERHARSLLTLKTNEEQIEWLNKILNERLTVRQLDIELKKLQNSTDDDVNIPIVNLTPDIDNIKENALDINPTQGIHNIESMLTPSVAGERNYLEIETLDDVETLDLDLDDNSVEVNNIVNTEVKPPNKFFNFLEDEVVNMDDLSIDEVFSNNAINEEVNNTQDDYNEEIRSVDTSSIINNMNSSIEQVESNEDYNTIDTVQDDYSEEVRSVDTSAIINNMNNSIEQVESNEDFNTINTVADDFNTINDLNFDSNPALNVIEEVKEVKTVNVFDPMNFVNTLEPDYQEQVEIAQGTDLNTAINKIRNLKNELELSGFNLFIDEADLDNSYIITININK